LQHEKGCLQKCQAARSQLTSVQNFTLPHLTRLSCEWLQSGKRVDLSTQDCVKLYVSSDDSRNPCPTHTSDSSACACSHTILLGVSERQSQTKCTNLLSCFLLFNWKGSNKCDLSANLVSGYSSPIFATKAVIAAPFQVWQRCCAIYVQFRDGQRSRKNNSSVSRPVNFKKWST